jgi:hypothetical protein
MVRAVLYTPSGHKLCTLELDQVQAAPTLKYDGKTYSLAGVQDGTAHYSEKSQ